MPKFLLVFIFISMNASVANELDNSLLLMCENLKKCAIERMNDNHKVTYEAKLMLKATFNKKCILIEKKFAQEMIMFPQHNKKALACISSLALSSCEDLLHYRDNIKRNDYDELIKGNEIGH